ncbi:hypothetical protein AOR13_94 [Alteromonas stellipolaris LMG 21856]|nr:hypothetical protein AOR13_94 [Alteromonas stellipolaris LMG 21856]
MFWVVYGLGFLFIMLLYAKKMHLDDLSLTSLTPTLMS